MVSKVFTVFSFIISLLTFVSSALKITLRIQYDNYSLKETLFSYVRKLKWVISFLLLPFINFSPYVKHWRILRGVSEELLFMKPNPASFTFGLGIGQIYQPDFAEQCFVLVCITIKFWLFINTASPGRAAPLKQWSSGEEQLVLRALILENKHYGYGHSQQTRWSENGRFKRNIIFLHDEKGNSFLSCCLLSRKLWKSEGFHLGNCLISLKSQSKWATFLISA